MLLVLSGPFRGQAQAVCAEGMVVARTGTFYSFQARATEKRLHNFPRQLSPRTLKLDS